MTGNERRIIQYDLNMKELRRFNSIKEATISLLGYKMSRYANYYSHIHQCLRGNRSKSAYGFIWRYEWEKDKK